eukprot:1485762-Pleurochrysis_carterae.AAC.1
MKRVKFCVENGKGAHNAAQTRVAAPQVEICFSDPLVESSALLAKQSDQAFDEFVDLSLIDVEGRPGSTARRSHGDGGLHNSQLGGKSLRSSLDESANELSQDDKARNKVLALAKSSLGGSLRPLRHLVSKQKRRFRKDGFDLDLSYITERIIAMGFPSEQIEGVYRNPMSEVLHFLNAKHRDHYMVYNLCSERSYDPAKLNRRVQVFPFDDHNPPPLRMIVDFCASVARFLDEHPSNTAVVHCKAGKGRTGVMISSFLLHDRFFINAEDALAFYGMKTHPSLTRRTRRDGAVMCAINSQGIHALRKDVLLLG